MELSIQVRKERNQFIPIYYLFTKKKCFCSRVILTVKELEEPCMVNKEKAPH